MHRIDELSYSLLPIAIVVGAMGGLILLEPDLGTAISLLMAVAAMVFAAGLNYRYLVGTVLAAVPVLYLLIASSPYRLRRLLAFLNPEADPLGDGFQVMQSLIAVGTGGVFGRGLMGGVQKLFFLPEPHTDFIYAVIGEELGLLGATTVLICFCVIAWRGVRIAMRAQDAFGSFLALGLTAMIAVQALVNISVVLGLLPTKGIPLPLVSSGGSSLMISLLAMGVLLNVSQHEERGCEGARMSGAVRVDRRWWNRRASVSGHCGGQGASRADSGCAGDVCRHRRRNRVARRAARRFHAGRDSQRGLKGKSLPSLPRGFCASAGSALDAWSVLSRRRPSVVIGVGGYSSGPVVGLAALRRIPTLLMEQNAVPGLTNRLLASLVSAAAVTYEESLEVFGAKAFVAGNPVRPEFFGEEAYGEHSSPPGAARVLVFGGSQGAHAINVAMVEAAPRLAAAAPAVAITHQSGERDLEMVRDGYRRAGLEARVEPFLFAMDREMKAADLVVCRSGATTLAELTASARPSILIPFPGATDDHQRKNAEALVEAGRAQRWSSSENSQATGWLARFCRSLTTQRSAGEWAKPPLVWREPNAANAIVDRILELAT